MIPSVEYPVDPKQVAGSVKTQLHLIPTEPKRACARVLELGASKYGAFNWRHGNGVYATTYISAMLRHIDQFTSGEDTDSESGESHLAHVMATCCVLLDAIHCGKLADDRPIIKG